MKQVMDQTWALLVDAYRELNSRRMFWIVLVISAMVAASFALVGLTEKGFSILGYDIPFVVNAKVISPATFYKLLFLNLGIEGWLTRIAACLALISTASIFPDFLAGGAVELYLARPMGRWRLFLTKYIFGLLFVGLQIACFCVASFVVIGVRGGLWEPGIFLAIPIVVIFYSYLFSFCVLIGVVTRSTVAAVLLTLLFWIAVYSIHTTEVLLLGFKLGEDRAVARLDAQIASQEGALARMNQTASTQPYDVKSKAALEKSLQQAKDRRATYHGKFVWPHQMFYEVATVLPKTTETVDLLERELVARADLPPPEQPSRRGRRRDDGDEMDVQDLQTDLRQRSVGWIMGTSLLFEGALLLGAGWVFCRRDY